MTRWLVGALGRRSPATRRLTVAAFALLGLLVVVSASVPSPHPAHRPVAPLAKPARLRRTPTVGGSRPISPSMLVGARRVAVRFLAGYLPFLYGRGSARSIDAVTPVVHVQLSRGPALVTPVERRRHPRLVSLTAVAQSPAAVLATALVADGGVTTYELRIVLRGGRGGWMVTSVGGG